MGINHRGYGEEIENSLCTLEKYPSAGITKKIIGCCNELRVKDGIKRLIL